MSIHGFPEGGDDNARLQTTDDSGVRVTIEMPSAKAFGKEGIFLRPSLSAIHAWALATATADIVGGARGSCDSSDAVGSLCSTRGIPAACAAKRTIKSALVQVPRQDAETLDKVALCFDCPKPRITRLNQMTSSTIVASSIVVPLNLSGSSTAVSEAAWIEDKTAPTTEFKRRTGCTDNLEAKIYLELANNDIEAAVESYEETTSWADNNPRVIQECEKDTQNKELLRRPSCCCRPKAEEDVESRGHRDSEKSLYIDACHTSDTAPQVSQISISA